MMVSEHGGMLRTKSYMEKLDDLGQALLMR